MENLEVSSQEDITEHNDSHLPPVDTGKGAWLFLAACFMIEALIWGSLMNFNLLRRNSNC